ncbi:NAD-dependent malic enzyme 4 [Hypericibacter terrae]|uniref:NAD-dependent malic enzyme 4 n=1 Tax=Hypericibacter terrae TaxID=2602015 RepID=A0A5J6MP12_9PROT|nr:NADP-dependent malic enzyme [Hypericibacter terrae]QEX19069.1 NAD-dependent malic enzyme 4 [Hypericibacter terrae]
MASPPVTKEAALAFGRDVYYGHGKIEILPKVAVHSLQDMAVAYTPGVGHAVREVQARPEALSELTAKDNLVAIVTDGTAVLGFGNAGPRAALPVMEGKATMFKLLAGIDCFPLCIQARDAAHLIDILEALEPGFGGYNIEDVAAPACFEVVRQLEQRVAIPAMHDDQYGTATVIAAGLINALKVTGRAAGDIRVVVNGIGAAGTATIDMLQALGVGEITAHDKAGIIYRGGDYPHEHWRRMAETTNRDRLQGDLATAMRGADVFIGVSVANQVTPEMVRSMARGPIVFGLANPEPEIRPDAALAAGAAIVASGRFDFPNHCNNVLAFPALMRAALDTKTRRVSREMCLAASRAIAAEVPDAELAPDLILPSPLSATLYPNVAEAVAREAVKQGLARVDPGVGAVAAKTAHLRRLVQERQRSLPAHPPGAAAP